MGDVSTNGASEHALHAYIGSCNRQEHEQLEVCILHDYTSVPVQNSLTTHCTRTYRIRHYPDCHISTLASLVSDACEVLRKLLHVLVSETT